MLHLLLSIVSSLPCTSLWRRKVTQEKRYLFLKCQLYGRHSARHLMWVTSVTPPNILSRWDWAAPAV